MSYETQGTAHDPHAAGYELQGRDKAAAPLDEKGYNASTQALLNAFPMADKVAAMYAEVAIRAYLAASHSPSMEMEVVAWAHFDEECEICINLVADAIERLDPSPGEDWSLVTLSSVQSALSAMATERDQLTSENEMMAKSAQDAWSKHGGTEIALGQWKARAETAEAQVQRLTEENEALRKERDGKTEEFRDKVALGATADEILRFRDGYPNPSGGSKIIYRHTIEQARYRYADAIIAARSTAIKGNGNG